MIVYIFTYSIANINVSLILSPAAVHIKFVTLTRGEVHLDTVLLISLVESQTS